MTRFFFLLIFIISPAGVSVSQTIPAYCAALDKADTAPAFDSIFQHMIVASRADKITLGYEDMEHIVTIARSKDYRSAVLADVYRWAGTMFANGDMDKAILFFLQSASLYESQGKGVAEAISFFEIAMIHHKARNFREARDYYDRTLKVGGDSLDRRTIINCYNGIALILQSEKQYAEAMTYYNRAFSIAENSRDTAWMGILYGNMGNVCYQREQYDSSLLYYLRDLAFIKRTSEPENEIETYLNIGRVYIKKRQPKRAMVYLDSTEYITRKHNVRLNNFFNPMALINEAYAQVYAQLGDYKQAFHYHEKFHAVQQEIQAQVKSKSLLQLQSTYAYQQKHQELEFLRQINEANQATIRQQRYTEVAFGLAILLLAAIAFMAYRTGVQRKALNVKLHTANEELGRLNTLKDRLITVVSHDFRTPLANVRMMLEMQQGNFLEPGDLEHWIASLNQQLKVSYDALEGLLGWARAQLQAADVVKEAIPLHAMVQKVAGQCEEDLRRKTLTLENSVPADCSVFADPSQVEIVIRNLLNNAIKFSYDQGAIRLYTTATDATVSLHVEDKGVGMSAADLEALFQTDKTFTRSGTRNEKGTGIGLIISREMMQVNGGDIYARSEGVGSTFTIVLNRF